MGGRWIATSIETILLSRAMRHGIAPRLQELLEIQTLSVDSSEHEEANMLAKSLCCYIHRVGRVTALGISMYLYSALISTTPQLLA
jgi:hypothetical protein